MTSHIPKRGSGMTPRDVANKRTVAESANVPREPIAIVPVPEHAAQCHACYRGTFTDPPIPHTDLHELRINSWCVTLCTACLSRLSTLAR